MSDISTALSRNDVRYALIAGLLVGGVSGYFVANRVVATKFERIAQEEIESVKEHYHRQAMLKKEGVYSDPANLVENPVTEKPEPGDTPYNEIVTDLGYDGTEEDVKEDPEVEEDDKKVVVNNVFKAPRPTIGERNPDEPYVISLEEFMNNEEYGFDQVTVTYFAGDDTLIDEREEIIPDVIRTVGVENLTRFGELSEDKTIVYVRNERLRTDFEVIRDEGKYSVTVLGMPNEDAMYTRKRPDSDVERDD